MNKFLSAINSADQATLGGLSRMARSPELGSEHRIPKRIIQTGKTIAQQLRCKAMIANIRLLHQDFEYRFFDNQAVDSFIDEEFPQYRKAFDSFRFPIQRYDF